MRITAIGRLPVQVCSYGSIEGNWINRIWSMQQEGQPAFILNVALGRREKEGVAAFARLGEAAHEAGVGFIRLSPSAGR